MNVTESRDQQKKSNSHPIINIYKNSTYFVFPVCKLGICNLMFIYIHTILVNMFCFHFNRIGFEGDILCCRKYCTTTRDFRWGAETIKKVYKYSYFAIFDKNKIKLLTFQSFSTKVKSILWLLIRFMVYVTTYI